MPAGRPTKYNEGMVESAAAYRDGAYQLDGSVIPSEVGLACHLGVCKATVQTWGAEYPEFLAILRGIQAKQERLLINNGLAGEFNAAITKLVLGKHGYHERTETDTTVTFKGMSDEDLQAIVRGES